MQEHTTMGMMKKLEYVATEVQKTEQETSSCIKVQKKWKQYT